MRLTILISATILVGAVSGAQAAEKGKPLDDAQCKATWTVVSPNGAAISKDKPVPSIIDWTMVDSNKGRDNRRQRVQGRLCRRLDSASKLTDTIY